MFSNGIGVVRDMVSDDPAASGALDGVRVVDLSRILAGPLCTQMLGDHGADVVKVEPPAGDDTRLYGPPYLEDGLSAYFSGLNRNKSNICLDLSTPPGREVLLRLLERADVVVENFKPGTMERWGLGYEETLSKRHPTLIYCRVTGYGADGPLGGLPGYDAVLQAYGGLMSVNGEATRDPLRVGVPVVDMVTGILSFSGILLALQERRRSGRGQLVDSALLDTALSLLHPHSASWLADGSVPVRTGSAHPAIAPYETFATEGGLFFLAAANDRQFAALTRVLQRQDLAEDARFCDNGSRVVNVDALREELRSEFERWDGEELGRALLAAGVPATRVNDVPEALGSEQARHRDMIVEREGYRGVGNPIKLSRTPATTRWLPAHKGEHTRRLLSDAGYSDAEVDALLATGVAAEP